MIQMQTDTNNFDSLPHKILSLADCLTSHSDMRYTQIIKLDLKYDETQQPFLKLILRDVSGHAIVGRMFNFNVLNVDLKSVNALVGKIVLVNYETTYVYDRLSLNITEIKQVTDDIRTKVSANLQTKLLETEQAYTKLRELIATYAGQDSSWSKTFNSSHEARVYFNFSDESLGQGTPGLITSVILNTLQGVNNTVRPEVIIAFLAVMCIYCKRSNSNPVEADLKHHIFVTQCTLQAANYETETKTNLISHLISNFVSLLSGDPKVVSPETNLVYNIYKSYYKFVDESYNLRFIPVGGRITLPRNILYKI